MRTRSAAGLAIATARHLRPRSARRFDASGASPQTPLRFANPDACHARMPSLREFRRCVVSSALRCAKIFRNGQNQGKSGVFRSFEKGAFRKLLVDKYASTKNNLRTAKNPPTSPDFDQMRIFSRTLRRDCRCKARSRDGTGKLGRNRKAGTEPESRDGTGKRRTSEPQAEAKGGYRRSEARNYDPTSARKTARRASRDTVCGQDGAEGPGAQRGALLRGVSGGGRAYAGTRFAAEAGPKRRAPHAEAAFPFARGFGEGGPRPRGALGGRGRPSPPGQSVRGARTRRGTGRSGRVGPPGGGAFRSCGPVRGTGRLGWRTSGRPPPPPCQTSVATDPAGGDPVRGRIGGDLARRPRPDRRRAQA